MGFSDHFLILGVFLEFSDIFRGFLDRLEIATDPSPVSSVVVFWCILRILGDFPWFSGVFWMVFVIYVVFGVFLGFSDIFHGFFPSIV